MLTYEVAVIGGGFAGLCFARHLIRVRPGTTIVIIDRKALPCASDRRHVGESTSEIAAWYLARRLGLRELLERDQVVKFGLRFWLRAPDRPSAIDQRREFGPMGAPPQLRSDQRPPLEPHAYQIHRGRFEAALAGELQRDGVDLLGGAEVASVSESGELSRIELRGAEVSELRCRWVIDASAGAELTRARHGRRARERAFPHALAAAWWWVEGRLDPASWAGPEVQARCAAALRWRSTHHFVGRDYWSWLIPLADGSTSVGVVANGERITQREPAALGPALRELLEREEPELWAALAAHEHSPTIAQRPPSRAFEAPLHRRWLVTGAALAFVDPLYSPAHDLSAIVHELAIPTIVAELEGATPSAAELAHVNSSFARILDYYAAIYLDSWPVLADPALASIKLGWDQLSYFGWLCPLAMSRRLPEPTTVQRLRPLAERVARLNDRVQTLLRRWAERRGDTREDPSGPRHIDLAQLRPLMDRFLALDALARHEGPVEIDALERHGARAVELLELVALGILERACLDLGLDLPAGPLDPYGIGLDPERWGADGLFEARRARERSTHAQADVDYLWSCER